LKGLNGKIFSMLGWRISGVAPTDIKKYILVVAPHTSNWDFFIGLGARSVLKFNPQYVAKKELFVWPFGWLFRRLGGYPVSRNSRTHFVDHMVSLFETKANFILTITPEGTRKHNAKWKTGFFYIARKANIPIIPIAFDYSQKKVVVGKRMIAEGKAEDFILELKKWFVQYEGMNREQGVLPSDLVL
jgi:1-acyl-sn-glycerol-3-phosphate acyltransferase